MSHILDLPVEILQLIADYPVDLTILRLVCKAFDAAFLDAFGREYLADLRCFILDSRRLARLKSITSQPHLVRRIQQVCLTFDALEHFDPRHAPIVRTKEWSVTDECEFHFSWRDSAAINYSHRVPDLTVLRSLLRDLKAAKRPRLELDFSDYHPQETQGLLCLSFPEVSSIFSAISTAGCRVSSLRLEDPSFLVAALDGPSQLRYDQFLDFGRSLETIAIDDVAGHGFPQTWEITTLLKAATGLQEFSIVELLHRCNCRTKAPALHCLKPLKATNSLLLALSSSVLRQVTFKSIQLNPSVLLMAMRSWGSTLEHLYIHCVYLHKGAKVTTGHWDWLEIFRCLRSFDKLAYLEVVGLMDEHSWSRSPNGKEKQGFVELYDLDGSVEDRLWQQNRQDVERALQINVERGMRKTLFYPDEDEDED